MRWNHLRALLAASLVCACFPSAPAAAQEQRGRVIQRIAFPDEPVDELEVEVGGRPVKLNSVFKAGQGWLKGLKVKAKNVSDRPIVFAEVYLNVPRLGTMEYPFGIPLRYGQPPSLEPTQPSEHKPVPPGKVFKLSLSDQVFQTTTNFLAEHQVTEVFEVKMARLMIVFDDGTAWNDGSRLHRDPSHPYRWVPDVPAGTAQTRRVIQKVSWSPPRKAGARPAWIDDVTYQCYTHFSSDYVLCGTQTGNHACIVMEYTPRPRDLVDLPPDRKALVTQSVPCEGANCSSTTRTVKVAEYSALCGYSGGNQTQ